MKNTYLYTLPSGARWLWTAGRAGAADLFRSPEVDAPQEDWVKYTGLSDHLGHMRDMLHEVIKEEPRVCIGNHYMIPGSLCEVSQSRESEASEAVRLVTLWTWDAPQLEDTTFFQLRNTLARTAGRDGADSRADLMAFLEASKGRRIVPVWM